MPQERRRGFFLSAMFHLVLLVVAIFGLPSVLNRDLPEPYAITVELLPVSEMSNVKPRTPAPKPEEKPKEKEQPKPSPPVKTEEPPPPPPEPEPVPDKKKKPKEPEKKKEEKKPEKKKPKEDDLAAVLKAVKETAQKEKKKKEKDEKEEAKEEKAAKTDRQSYDDSLPMSLSEKDAIRSQIATCWNVPAGAKDAQDLIVVLKLRYEADGSLLTVELGDASKSRYNSDSFFRAAADSAMRAVRQCSPLKNLPADKFHSWRDMELTFDPREMLF